MSPRLIVLTVEPTPPIDQYQSAEPKISIMTSKPMIIVGAFVALAAISTLEASPTESLLSQWTEFKAQYGKQYASAAEEAKRLELFAKNKLEVDKFNLERSAEAGYTLAVNHLSDRTSEELGFKLPAEQEVQPTERGHLSESLREILENDEPVPDSIDWREHGRVTPVKDQGNCGSYWAFSAVGMLEGQLLPRKKANETISLSVQNIIDCGRTHDPCRAGVVNVALLDVAYLGGVESDADYPYKAAKEACKFDKSKAVIANKFFQDLIPADGKVLKKLVATYGPISATVKVNYEGTFKNYKSGVFSDDNCFSGLHYWNLSVLIVGYGTDPKGGDYWIVKNSWSTAWGEDGYIRMARYKDTCEIENFAVLATF